MIAKIMNISSFSATIKYVRDMDSLEKKPKYVCSNLMGAGYFTNEVSKTEYLAGEMALYKTKRGLKHPGKHITISLSPGETLDQDQWSDVVKNTLNELGYEGSKYIAFTHHDKDHEHVHIVVNRCKMNKTKTLRGLDFFVNSGVAVKDSNDRLSVMKCMRFIEAHFGLKSGKSESRDKIHSAEYRIKKRGINSNKESFRQALRMIKNQHKNRDSFIEELENMGIDVFLKTNENNEIKGISYGIDDRVYPGYKLGKDFTAPGLNKWFLQKEKDKKEEIQKRLESIKNKEVHRVETKAEKQNETIKEVPGPIYQVKSFTNLKDKVKTLSVNEIIEITKNNMIYLRERNLVNPVIVDFLNEKIESLPAGITAKKTDVLYMQNFRSHLVRVNRIKLDSKEISSSDLLKRINEADFIKRDFSVKNDSNIKNNKGQGFSV